MKKDYIILFMGSFVFLKSYVDSMVPSLYELSTAAVSKEMSKKYCSKVSVHDFKKTYADIHEYLAHVPSEVANSVCDYFCFRNGWFKQPHSEHILLETTDSNTEISFSRCNQFASLSCQSQVDVWDLDSFTKIPIPALRRGKMKSIAFSPDGNIIAVGMNDGNIFLYNCEHEMWSTQPMNAHMGAVTSLGFSPDCQTLVSGSDDQTVELWDVATGMMSQKRKMVPSGVLTVSFSPDGKEIGVGLRDKTVSLYAVNDEVSEASFKGCVSNFGALTFDASGSVLASGGDDGVIHFLNIGQQREEDRKLSSCKTNIVSVAYSPEGNLLASSSSDGMVCLWDVKRREYLRKLICEKDGIKDGNQHEVVCFSTDGTCLISAGQVIKLWQRDNFETAVCKIALMNSSHSKKVRGQLYKTLCAHDDDFVCQIDPYFLNYLKG